MWDYSLRGKWKATCGVVNSKYLALQKQCAKCPCVGHATCKKSGLRYFVSLFTFIGVTNVLVGFLEETVFIVVCCLISWQVSQFMNMRGTSTSLFPRLSPSSWSVQQWSKKTKSGLRYPWNNVDKVLPVPVWLKHCKPPVPYLSCLVGWSLLTLPAAWFHLAKASRCSLFLCIIRRECPPTIHLECANLLTNQGRCWL